MRDRLRRALLGAACGWLLALWTAAALRLLRPAQVPPGMLLATASFVSSGFAYVLGLYGLLTRPAPKKPLRLWLEGALLGLLGLAVSAALTMQLSPDVRDLVWLGAPVGELLRLYGILLGRAAALGLVSLALPVGFPLAAFLLGSLPWPSKKTARR